jgi:hypothetical protein
MKNSLAELTLNFKAIEPSDIEVFKTYYASFFNLRKYPRYYQSLLELGMYVNVPDFYWGIVNDCLVIVKKKWINNPVLYLILPPMHINNNLNAEKEVISQFAQNGINCKLSEEDIELYGYKEEVTIDKDNYEFVYDVNTFALLDDKKIRYYVTQYKKINELRHIVHTESPNQIAYQKCEDLVTRWLKHKELKKIHSGHKTFGKFINSGLNAALSIIDNVNSGLTIGFSVTEQIGSKHAIITSRFRDYDYLEIKDPNYVIHYLDCKYWYDTLGDNALLSIGSGVNVKGLVSHKAKLRPVKTLQLYNFKTDKKITREDWDSSCKFTPKGLFD